MAAPMNTRGALNHLTQSLNDVEGPTASALRLAGSSEEDYNEAMNRVVQSIDNRKGLIGKIPRANAIIGIKPNANQSAKGKLILNYIESGFNRYLLSIDICIVLLRAKNVDLQDVKPALNFVDTLKNFYETLCSFVVDVPTNNAKVGSVKGALDSLLAVPIPGRIMDTLNGVGGEAKNGNAGGFPEYTARVKDAAAATIKQPNVANAVRAAAEAAQKAVNKAAAAAAAVPAPVAPLAATGAPLPPPPPQPAIAPLPAAAPPAANPELIGILTRDVKDGTGVKYKLADNNEQPKLLDNFINYQDNLYFISKIKNTGLTNVTAKTFYKVSKGSTNASYYLLDTTLNNNGTLYLYKLPKIKGGRRRTNAKAKASRKTKAKAKSKRRSTRRNRRS